MNNLYFAITWLASVIFCHHLAGVCYILSSLGWRVIFCHHLAGVCYILPSLGWHLLYFAITWLASVIFCHHLAGVCYILPSLGWHLLYFAITWLASVIFCHHLADIVHSYVIAHCHCHIIIPEIKWTAYTNIFARMVTPL
jgi:hypothetical protein